MSVPNNLKSQFLGLWAAGTASSAGSIMQRLVLSFYLVESTDSARWVGAMFAATWIARAAFMPLAGGLVDRYGPKRTLMVTSVAQAAIPVLLIALFVSDHADPLAIVAVELMAGALTGFEFPARSTLFIAFRPPDRVYSGSMLGNASISFGWVGGALMAAPFAVSGNYELAFAVNAITFCLVLLMATLASPRALAGKSTSLELRKNIRAGANALWAVTEVRRVVIVSLLGVALLSPITILLAPMGQIALDGGAWVNTALACAMGLAGTVGGLAAAWLVDKRVSYSKMFVYATYLVVPFAIVYALSPVAVFAVVAISVYAIVETISMESGGTAYVQHRVAPALVGSATGLYLAGWNFCFGVGGAVGGVIADAIGLRPTFIGLALIYAATLVIISLLKPGFWTSIIHPPARTEPDHVKV